MVRHAESALQSLAPGNSGTGRVAADGTPTAPLPTPETILGGTGGEEVRLRELRKLRNSHAVLGNLDRLYKATEALEQAMKAAYEGSNETDILTANCTSTMEENCSSGGSLSSTAQVPRPGNFHGVKSHAYYVGAISEAHPSLPPASVQSIVASEWYHPGLTAKAVWCTRDCGSQFPVARRLDANFEAIQREVQAFWSHEDASREIEGVGSHTTPVDRLIAGNGTWVDVRLWRGRAFNKRLCERHFRVICGIVEASPEIWTNPWSHVLLSVLLHDSWVPFHQGHTNGQLTYHLPLSLPARGSVAELAVVDRGGTLEDTAGSKDSKNRILTHPDERVVHWSLGKTLVFDDSFTHAVRYRAGEAPQDKSAPGARVVLLMRGWHQELEPEERMALRDFVRRGGEEDPKGYEMLPVAPCAFGIRSDRGSLPERRGPES